MHNSSRESANFYILGTLHVGTQPTDGGAKGAKGCRGGSTGWLDFDQVLKLGAQGRDWWEGKSSSVPEYHGPHPGQVSDRNFSKN